MNKDTQTKVVNIYRDGYDVYIGRAGKGQDGYFGNPFRLAPGGAKGSTLERYREYFYNRLAEDPEFKRRIHKLKGRRLGCFCKPHACHGDIRNVLKHIEYIGHLCITGGDPSMDVKAMRYILKQVKRFEIEVYEFYIVTNGSENSFSDEFITICSGLYEYQNNKDMKEYSHMLEMSDDRFHDNSLHRKVIRKLKRYPFFGLRGQAENIFLFKEGRSLSGNENTVRELYVSEGNYLKGDVYLNAKGMILSNGDMSYQRQEENILCHLCSFFSYVKYHVEKY